MDLLINASWYTSTIDIDMVAGSNISSPKNMKIVKLALFFHFLIELKENLRKDSLFLLLAFPNSVIMTFTLYPFIRVSVKFFSYCIC